MRGKKRRSGVVVRPLDCRVAVLAAGRERQAQRPLDPLEPAGTIESGKGEWADKPGSVIRTTIYLEHASPHASSAQPGYTEGLPYRIPICVCSRWGLPSYVVANALVRFYRTVSAFLLHAGESSFLWHCPSGRPAQPLAGILPLGARTFLMLAHAIARLTRMYSIHCSANNA